MRTTDARLMAVALAAVTALGVWSLAQVQPALAASTTRTFPAGTGSRSAVYAPASTSYGGSSGTHSLAVAGTSGSEAVMVTVPPTGTLAVTVATGAVTMHRIRGRLVATGMLPDISVTDARNYAPGWSVSGQESAFTARGTRAAFPGDELGWVPVAVSPLAGGASLGPAIAPGTRNGLGTGSLLAYAGPGSGLGTNALSATLTLDLPNSALANLYIGSLTITYLETGPQAGGTAGVGY